jgi:RNA polymerase sigma-70 factor (ECF subfamily)
MSDAEDRQLLERIARHDRLAFEAFFTLHGTAVQRFVRDLVRDDGLAEELTSDVMVEVWRSAGKFAGRSRARTWFFGIAHHKAIDALRRRRHPTVALDALREVASPLEGPEAAALRGAAHADLDAALARLSPDHRAVLQLTYLEGFSQREIADIVNAPVATIKTRAFYAKQQLRTTLAPAESA